MLGCSPSRVRGHCVCPESDLPFLASRGRVGQAAGRGVGQGFPGSAVFQGRRPHVSCVCSCVNPIHGGHSHVIGLSRP